MMTLGGISDLYYSSPEIIVGIFEHSYLDILKVLFLTIIIELFIAILIKKYFDKQSLSKLFSLIGIGVILYFLINLLLSIIVNIMFVDSNIDLYDFIGIISVVIESILILLLLIPIYFYFKKNYFLLTVVLINIITNPILNFIILLTNHNLLMIIILEIIVVFVEYLLLNYVLGNDNKKQHFILSLLMNLGSYLIGTLLFL